MFYGIKCQIVPINSSKILLGNEFTLYNKGTYGNVMEKLINSIKLISFNYMYSSNKTLDRFGIEYSYIASAMGNMLKSANNGIKNISIDKAVGILIDWTWACVFSIIEFIGAWIAVFGGALYVPATFGLAGALWFLAIGLAIGSTAAMAITCNSSGW